MGPRSLEGLLDKVRAVRETERPMMGLSLQLAIGRAELGAICASDISLLLHPPVSHILCYELAFRTIFSFEHLHSTHLQSCLSGAEVLVKGKCPHSKASEKDRSGRISGFIPSAWYGPWRFQSSKDSVLMTLGPLMVRNWDICMGVRYQPRNITQIP